MTLERQEPRLAVAFDIALEDIHAFNAHYARTAPLAIRGRRTARFAMTFVLAALLAALGGGFRMPVLFYLFGAMILLAFWAVFPARVDQRMRRQTTRMYAEGKNHGLLGPHTVSLEDEWLVEKSELREVKTHWRAVERVETTAAHAFIYVTGFTAVIVPRRAFESDEAFAAFVEEVKRRAVS